MELDVYKYIEDAIRRIQAGEIFSKSGSHLAGVYGIAAQKYEQLMRKQIAKLLKVYHVDYDSQIRLWIKGETFLSKLTLGQIALGFELLINIPSVHISPQLFVKLEKQSFVEKMKLINKKWVQVKHGNGIRIPEALEHLKYMLHTLDCIKV